MNKRAGKERPMSGYGRKLVTAKDNPRANTTGQVVEYYLVAERAYGGYLPRGVSIHHVDGDSTNNANNNLVICQDEAYHRLLHRRARALAACGHASWRKCTYCKEYDDESNLAIRAKVKGKNQEVYHSACRAAWSRERRRQKVLETGLTSKGTPRKINYPLQQRPRQKLPPPLDTPVSPE
jgi:hypothetical protein